MSSLTEAQIAWLRTGERGTSSLALFERLTGHVICGEHERTAHPLDPRDLRRCLLMLERCGLADQLHLAADLSEAWGRLVPVWKEITASLEGEVSSWRVPVWGAAARSTYRLMRQVLND